MLEENKALVRSFLEKANRDERIPVEMCAPSFAAHIGGVSGNGPASILKPSMRYWARISRHLRLKSAE